MREKTAGLKIHGFVPFSRANGPGIRAVVWVQGCSLHCSDCYNPETHSCSAGTFLTVAELFAQISAIQNQIEGITISGGEPLQQVQSLIEFLTLIRKKTDLSMIVFTGYTWEEVRKMKESRRLLKNIDLLIAGRYDRTKRLAKDLKGSSNKTLHFLTRRYSKKDLTAVPVSEVIVKKDGHVILTGIDLIPLYIQKS